MIATSTRPPDPPSEIKENYTGCFEGPEKTMEVCFNCEEETSDLGLRSLSRDQLNRLCTLASCTILSSISNVDLDAYVLSESSLFVYKNKFILKTCGTTTLLRCLDALIDFADGLGIRLSSFTYSRKNLNFPEAQLAPHKTFADEVAYIQQSKISSRLSGFGSVLGHITGDHWYVYVADVPKAHIPRNFTSQDRTLNLMMFDIPADVRNIFYKDSSPTGQLLHGASCFF
jgi:S-adenosylmethionine decarboxylase